MFRGMRRFKQQLSEEECRKVLSEGKVGVLAVAGDDGYPYTIPLNYQYDTQSGNLYFHGAAEGHKIDSIRRSGKVSFNVLSDPWKAEGEWWRQFNSVTIFGRIRIVEEEALREEELRAIGRKYLPDETHVEEEMRRDAARACILELCPEHMTGKHVREK